MSKCSHLLKIATLSIFLIGGTTKQAARPNEIQQAIGAGDEVVIYLSIAQMTSFPYTKQRIEGASTYITRIKCGRGACFHNLTGLVNRFGTARLQPNQQDCGDEFRAKIVIITNSISEPIYIANFGRCVEFRNNVWHLSADITAFLRIAGLDELRGYGRRR